MLPGKAVGGAGVGTAMGTPTLPLPLFSRLLLRLLLGWLPPLLPLLREEGGGGRGAQTLKHSLTQSALFLRSNKLEARFPVWT